MERLPACSYLVRLVDQCELRRAEDGEAGEP